MKNNTRKRAPVKALPSQNILREYLDYNPDTGIFVWIKKSAKHTKLGSVAGTPLSTGYIVIDLFGARYSAHRLAWKYVHGFDPVSLIDHKNRIKTDNRIENLRECSLGENQANVVRTRNKNGYEGVEFHKQTGKYIARWKGGGKCRYLGLFSTPSEAGEAFRAAKYSHYDGFEAS